MSNPEDKSVIFLASGRVPFGTPFGVQTIVKQIPTDIVHFQDLIIGKNTSNKNALIMGRRTWESRILFGLGFPLDECLNVVISSTPKSLNVPPGVLTFVSFEDAYHCLKLIVSVDCIYVIGGEMLMESIFRHESCNKTIYTDVFESMPTYHPSATDPEPRDNDDLVAAKFVAAKLKDLYKYGCHLELLAFERLTSQTYPVRIHKRYVRDEEEKEEIEELSTSPLQLGFD